MELVKSADASAGRPASLKSIADAGLPHWHVVIDCGCVVALLGACCAFIIVAAAPPIIAAAATFIIAAAATFVAEDASAEGSTRS